MALSSAAKAQAPAGTQSSITPQKIQGWVYLWAFAVLITLALWSWIFISKGSITLKMQPTTGPSVDSPPSLAEPVQLVERDRKSPFTTIQQTGLYIAGILTTIISIGSSLAILRAKVYVPLKSTLHRTHATIDTLERLDKLWSPNGGSSYADAVFQIREELFLTKCHLHIIQRHLDIPTMDMDEFGQVEDVNGPLMKLLNCTENDLYGNGWLSFISDGDQSRVFNYLKEAVQQHRDFQLQFTLSTRDGPRPYKLRAIRRVIPPETLNGFVVSFEELEVTQEAYHDKD